MKCRIAELGAQFGGHDRIFFLRPAEDAGEVSGTVGRGSFEHLRLLIQSYRLEFRIHSPGAMRNLYHLRYPEQSTGVD